MAVIQSERKKQILSTGLEAQVMRRAGDAKWRIRSVSVKWGQPDGDGWRPNEKIWLAGSLGLADFEFDNPASAFVFLEKHAHIDTNPMTTPPVTQSKFDTPTTPLRVWVLVLALLLAAVGTILGVMIKVAIDSGAV